MTVPRKRLLRLAKARTKVLANALIARAWKTASWVNTTSYPT